MKIIDCEQRSDEWFKARLGVPTASSFDKIITTKGVPSKSAKTYLYKLAGEFVSGASEETYQSAAMIRGCDLECEARNLYNFITGRFVEEVGFCLKEGFGASPDGLVGKDGLLEIKCPLISTQVSYLLDKSLPTAYIQQVQGQLLVTGRKWCDFMSFYPGLDPLIVRVERDEEFIGLLKIELKLFCAKLADTIEKIK